MVRWRRIIGLCAAVFCLFAPAADARATSYGKALLASCDRDTHVAMFQGQMSAFKRAKMQMRFTLQVSTPDAPRFRRVAADGFGAWITAPAVRRYTYDKTVEGLLVPANYRMVVDFRWRDARGRTLRSERATSPVCKQPDLRPDLVLRNIRHDRDGYVAVVVNRGKQPAGAFDVEFLRNGKPIGRTRVLGVAPGANVDVFLPGPPCGAGEELLAVVDPLSEVDEFDEENDSFQVAC
jgi:hypothetical protein